MELEIIGNNSLVIVNKGYSIPGFYTNNGVL